MPRGASNLHVSHSKNRLIVTWESVEVSDWEGDDGVVFRERLEKHFHRTIPLPEGTRVTTIYPIPSTVVFDLFVFSSSSKRSRLRWIIGA